MALTSKSYPRANVKKILKGQSNKSIRRTVDPLVYLDYVQFMQELLRNATRRSRAAGEKKVAARDIRKVTLTTLRKFKG